MRHDLGGANVSRETIDRLQEFANLVRKWTVKINLISPSTVETLWERHIIDSAQIYASAPNSFEKWVDIGSGGGFPGIVVAIIGKEKQPDAEFVLIESDLRKATFLRTAIRELRIPATVIADRIEVAPPQDADIVSARALSTLSTLLPYVDRHLNPAGIAILHKGKKASEEVAAARDNWRFALEDSPSLTDPHAQILVVKGISRASK
ncbi:16S rRNA m(7)G-527 methyltransferase [Yoonia tamlensis]|uniref:Ribosomal RNA small subunit methyltransferase G n=1 Tax=Yoonia tamlensis TaxID=390270 RepID=A0A1I6HHL4_9RHOB|nr:16S rRNA (guanine(527)-N(7))-methyltransferase RsmG [Yoonia tamlensis]SFR53951.1 16S rRNA m(7)G-527 methyltransferase [Yoonia tamlensis]